MSLRFYFIEGQRRQACNNDAVSVVNEGESPVQVLSIIPATEIPGNGRTEKLQNAPLVYAGRLPRLQQ